MTDQKKCCCQNPEIAKQDPKECSPEQVQQCHGEVNADPCEGEGEDS